jgi:preprotein translocase subunit SecE
MINKGSSITLLNYAKWFIGLVLIFMSAMTNSYYAGEPLLYRVIGIIILISLSILIILKTSEGSIAFKIILDSRNEIKRVVWPTRSETTSTSMIVIAVVTLAGLILWGLDSLFSWATASLLG